MRAYFCTMYDLTRQHRGPFVLLFFFGRLPNSIMVSTEENLKKTCGKHLWHYEYTPISYVAIYRLNEGDTIIEIHISNKFISKNEF